MKRILKHVLFVPLLPFQMDISLLDRKEKSFETERFQSFFVWYARLDSNQRPSESESDALSNCATGAYTNHLCVLG